MTVDGQEPGPRGVGRWSGAFAALLLGIAGGRAAAASTSTLHPHHHRHPQRFTGCYKDNCMADPRAWAALMGDTPEDRTTQAMALVAAQQMAARPTAPVMSDLNAIPLIKRAQLLDALEDTLSQLTATKATITSARMHHSGAGFLFCGSALYGYAGAGDLYIFDTNPGGPASAHATADDYVNGGCTQASTGLVLR